MIIEFEGYYCNSNNKLNKIVGNLEEITTNYFQGKLQDNQKEKDIFALRIQKTIDELFILVPFNKAVLYVNREINDMFKGTYDGHIYYFDKELPKTKNIEQLFPKNEYVSYINFNTAQIKIKEKV